MDEEARQIAEQRAKISRVTLAVEEIFLKEDLTMGELGEVMDMFNARAHAVFSKSKVKTIKETYERQT